VRDEPENLVLISFHFNWPDFVIRFVLALHHQYFGLITLLIRFILSLVLILFTKFTYLFYLTENKSFPELLQVRGMESGDLAGSADPTPMPMMLNPTAAHDTDPSPVPDPLVSDEIDEDLKNIVSERKEMCELQRQVALLQPEYKQQQKELSKIDRERNKTEQAAATAAAGGVLSPAGLAPGIGSAPQAARALSCSGGSGDPGGAAFDAKICAWLVRAGVAAEEALPRRILPPSPAPGAPGGSGGRGWEARQRRRGRDSDGRRDRDGDRDGDGVRSGEHRSAKAPRTPPTSGYRSSAVLPAVSASSAASTASSGKRNPQSQLQARSTKSEDGDRAREMAGAKAGSDLLLDMHSAAWHEDQTETRQGHEGSGSREMAHTP